MVRASKTHDEVSVVCDQFGSPTSAVELAKMFGGDDSGSFVNGILGKIASGKKDSGEAPKRRRPTHQAKIIIRSSKKDAPKSETKAEPEENSDN